MFQIEVLITNLPIIYFLFLDQKFPNPPINRCQSVIGFDRILRFIRFIRFIRSMIRHPVFHSFSGLRFVLDPISSSTRLRTSSLKNLNKNEIKSKPNKNEFEIKSKSNLMWSLKLVYFLTDIFTTIFQFHLKLNFRVFNVTNIISTLEN